MVTNGNPVREACDRVGGVAKLAERLGIQRQSVYYWIEAGKVPAPRVVAVEHLTGVPRDQLNPMFRDAA